MQQETQLNIRLIDSQVKTKGEDMYMYADLKERYKMAQDLSEILELQCNHIEMLTDAIGDYGRDFIITMMQKYPKERELITVEIVKYYDEEGELHQYSEYGSTYLHEQWLIMDIEDQVRAEKQRRRDEIAELLDELDRIEEELEYSDGIEEMVDLVGEEEVNGILEEYGKEGIYEDYWDIVKEKVRGLWEDIREGYIEIEQIDDLEELLWTNY